MRRPWPCARLGALGALFAVAAAARPAEAQEVLPRGPGGACIDIAILEAVPAVAEWSWWLASGGGTVLGGGAPGGLGIFGIGSEMTAGLALLGSAERYGGPVELRWGPWMSAVTDFTGARSEGGLLLSIGQTRHARWGTFALRLGGGLGDDSLGPAPHVTVTLTGGVRYVKERSAPRGACDPPAPPKPTALASGLRIFATARAAMSEERPWQLTFGVELEPSFLLPPHSLKKWGGVTPP